MTGTPVTSTQLPPPKLPLLIILAAMGPLAINIVMPAMGHLIHVFETSYGRVQLILTVYLAAMGVGQLFVGFISDRIGRRPTVLWGCLACALAPTLAVALIGRVIQALGACSGFVMSRAIIRDMHGAEQTASKVALMTAVMVLVPMFSPALGGIIDENLGWRAVFLFTTLFGGLAYFWSLATLGETHTERQVGGTLRHMFADFWALSRNRQFVLNSLQMSLTAGGFFAFLAGAPYVATQLMGHSSAEFGLYFLMPAFAYMIGNFFTSRYTERIGMKPMMLLGIVLALIGPVILVPSYYFGALNLFTLFAGQLFISLGNGLCLPPGTAGAVSADPHRIGAAAGYSGSILMGSGAAISALVGAMLTDSALPLIAVQSLCMVLSLATVLVLVRGKD